MYFPHWLLTIFISCVRRVVQYKRMESGRLFGEDDPSSGSRVATEIVQHPPEERSLKSSKRLGKNSYAFPLTNSWQRNRILHNPNYTLNLPWITSTILKPMIHGSTSCNICCSSNVEQCCTNVLNGIELVSIFVQHRSTTFNVLNGIFQHSTWHDTLFNICWTRAATFVDQQTVCQSKQSKTKWTLSRKTTAFSINFPNFRLICAKKLRFL